MTHAEILTRSLHKSQLEASEAVTSKPNYESVREAYQVRTKKPKRELSSTSSYTEPTGTKIMKYLGKTSNYGVNRDIGNPSRMS